MITYPTNKLQKVLLGGKCEQNGTPSPDTPVDIVCNNGVVKVANFVQKSRMELSSWSVIKQSLDTIDISDNIISFTLGEAPTSDFVLRGSPNFSQSNMVGHKVYIVLDFLLSKVATGGVATGDINGTLNNISILQDISSQKTTWQTGKAIAISTNKNFQFQVYPRLLASDWGVGDFYKIRNYQVFDLTEIFGSGNEPSTIEEIENGIAKVYGQKLDYYPYTDGTTKVYTDGTQETVTVTGKNLLDMVNANIHTGYISSNINQPIVWQPSSVTNTVVDAISVKAGETYTFSSVNGIDGNLILNIISNDTVLQKVNYFITANQRASASITATANGQLYIQYVVAGQDFQLELGSTATEYEPYFNGGTANAEMLLSVGDYKDTQEVLGGNVTRNVGIKVLDGSETWRKYSGNTWTFLTPLSNYNKGQLNRPVISTHFKKMNDWNSQNGIYIGNNMVDGIHIGADGYFSNVDDFKAWLADQYAAGTPVIVIYPLATPTTEQVTPQPLAGSSATVTAGSIDNLPIESSTIAELKKRYIGDMEVKRVYIGDNLVYNRND